MLKIYNLWGNSGDWNRIHHCYVIAESKEEAIEKCDSYKNWISIGWDHFCKELDGNDILNRFGIHEGQNCNTYP